MSKEIPLCLQYDLFSGELVDTRNEAQRKRDRERVQPQQMEMFAAPEIAQFGVNPRPLLSLSEHTRLTLWQQDPRTEAEILADRQRAAAEANYKLLEGAPEQYAAVLTPWGAQPETNGGRGEQTTAEASAPAHSPTPTDPSEVVGAVENKTAADEENPNRTKGTEEQRLHALFFNVLARAAYPNGANHRAGLTPGALAALNEQMVAHIHREVSREGFWEVDWAQEALQEWVWHFLEMHCLTEGDLQRCEVAAAEIMQVARRVWETPAVPETAPMPSPESQGASTMSPIASGFDPPAEERDGPTNLPLPIACEVFFLW